MKVLSLSMLFVTFACVASALPQTPGTGCDSVAICNDLCGKQGKVSSTPTDFMSHRTVLTLESPETRGQRVYREQCSVVCVRSQVMDGDVVGSGASKRRGWCQWSGCGSVFYSQSIAEISKYFNA
ncbi:hypothetical protein CGMCC3_g12607 [Colletotrichum fructicola]|nr:uncharacterized protein CGMCC3_g12607 [Colletotrichum fructicola]KAE9571335.1 hypothetical protein CGMCC3_g12607 [Colletotrichum fructicola]